MYSKNLIHICVIVCLVSKYYNVIKIVDGGFDCNMSKFVITPKDDKTITMTIRIDRALQEEYNELAIKTNRSRNELIGMALRYALDNMELKDEK